MDSPVLQFMNRISGYGELAAFICDDQAFSYSYLSGRIDFFREILDEKGIGPGTTVSIAGDYSPETIALLLALLQRNAIAVPLSKLSPKEKEERQNIAEIQHEFDFISSRDFVHHSFARIPSNRLLLEFRTLNAPGLIMFTSGSTGAPKGILHDFRRVLARFGESGSRFRGLAFLLFDHMGGLNTLFYNLANGGTTIPVRNWVAGAVIDLIEKHGVEVMPVTPSFLNLLIVSGAWRGRNLSSVRSITYGSEPMPESVLHRVREAFPHVRLLQTYGLTEFGAFRMESTEGTWMRFRGNQGAQIRNGTIWIRSEQAMVGYLNAPPPFSADGWFDTGDEVEVKGEYFRILGRRSSVINVGGQKVYPTEVENIILGLKGVMEVDVFAEPNLLLGQIVAAKVRLNQPEDASHLIRRVREHCRGQLSEYKIPMKIEIAES